MKCCYVVFVAFLSREIFVGYLFVDPTYGDLPWGLGLGSPGLGLGSPGNDHRGLMGLVGLYGAQWCHEAHPWFSSSRLGLMAEGQMAGWDDGGFWLVFFLCLVG